VCLINALVVRGVGIDMEEQDTRQVAESVWKALQAGDWETAGGYLHQDFVQEWPQSGERIVGRDNAIAINQNFPGGLPRMRFRRTLTDGDLAVLEIELTYADGSHYLGVFILELTPSQRIWPTAGQRRAAGPSSMRQDTRLSEVGPCLTRVGPICLQWAQGPGGRPTKVLGYPPGQAGARQIQG
jgi:hypothetical protein